MKILLLLFVGSFLSFFSSCSSPNFPEYIQLGTLRILSLRTKAPGLPEVNPGASVTLQALVSDVNGNGRALSYSVAACQDPGIGIGAVPQCAGTPDFQIGSTAIPTLDNRLGTNTYTGIAPEFTVPMPDSSIFNNQAPEVQYNGIPYLIFYTVTAADGTTVSSFRRILISPTSKTAKNNNPQITSITLNSTTLTTTQTNTLPTGQPSLAITYPASSIETYQAMQNDGTLVTQTETLVTTWFLSDGSMQYYRTTNTDSDQWTPPATMPSTRGVDVIAVTRDGRGGEDFQIVEFH